MHPGHLIAKNYCKAHQIIFLFFMVNPVFGISSPGYVIQLFWLKKRQGTDKAVHTLHNPKKPIENNQFYI
jgi:hypothetical protein